MRNKEDLLNVLDDDEVQLSILLQAILVEVEVVILHKYEMITSSQYKNIVSIINNKKVLKENIEEFDEVIHKVLTYRSLVEPIVKSKHLTEDDKMDILLDLVNEQVLMPDSIETIKDNDILYRLIPLWGTLTSILKEV